MKPGAIALAACIVLAMSAVHAQVYKWVDKDGRTHYGEKPPDDVKSAPVAVPPPGPARSATETTEDWKLRETEFRKRRIEREGKERAAEPAERPDPARCARARRELGMLREQIRVFQRNEKGEPVYMEDRDRPAAIATAEERVAASCKGL